MEVTGTFKQMKVKLVEQGFDPVRIQDPLYILDDSEKSYVPLTAQIYNAILSGNMKLWVSSKFSTDVQPFGLLVLLTDELPAQGRNWNFLIFLCDFYIIGCFFF